MDDNINNLLNKIKDKHNITLNDDINVNIKELNSKKKNKMEKIKIEKINKEVINNKINEKLLDKKENLKWENNKLKYGIFSFKILSLITSIVPLVLSNLILFFNGTEKIILFNNILCFIGIIISHSFANIINIYNNIFQYNQNDEEYKEKLENIIKIKGFLLICFFGIILANLDSSSILKLSFTAIPLFLINSIHTFKILNIKNFGLGLGELSIFLCFGPLLMECFSIILTKNYDFDIFIFSLPIGLITVNILHANNVCNLENDLNNNIKTSAYYINEFNLIFYQYIFAISYFIPILASLFLNNTKSIYNFLRTLTLLLNLPWTVYLIRCFENKNLKKLPEKTVKHNLLFTFILISTILPCDMYARLLLGFLFILGGISNVIEYQNSYALLDEKLKMILPDINEKMISFLLIIAIIIQLICSLLFIIGIYPKIAVQMMIAFLAPFTFSVHNFWVIENESLNIVNSEKESQVFSLNSDFVNFLKNISIIGGCLIFLLFD